MKQPALFLLTLLLLLTTAGVATSAVTLGWDAPTTGPAPDGYILERRLPPSTTWAEQWRGTALQATDPIAGGQQVCWRVRSMLLSVVSTPTVELCRHIPLMPTNLRILFSNGPVP